MFPQILYQAFRRLRSVPVRSFSHDCPEPKFSLVLGASLIIALFIAANPASAQNQITGVRLLSENGDEVSLQVSYRYSGDQGPAVFVGAQMAHKGEVINAYEFRPGRAVAGTGQVGVGLRLRGNATRPVVGDQIVVIMYADIDRPFLRQSFGFTKTWVRLPTALRPALISGLNVRIMDERTLGVLRPMGAGDGGSGTPQRRILPDGGVEVTYPDGMVKRFYRGRTVIIYPNGQQSMAMEVNALRSTPPPFPPDGQHRDWLEEAGESLLNVMRVLVANDTASINSYLAREGSAASPYERVNARIEAINYMLRP